MARVPYSPVPEVAMSTQATPNVNVPVNIEAFGGTVASAIKSVGDTVDKAGDEIFIRAKAMAQLENESIVRDSEAEHTIQQGELRNKFLSTEGKNTVEGLRQHIQDVRDLQRKFADSMPNPMARRLFERSTRIQMSQGVFQAARYAATQQKAWLERSQDAVRRANEAETYHNPDPNSFDRSIANVRQQALEKQGTEGWDDVTRDEWQREQESKLVFQRASGMARTNPTGANDFFKKYKDRMTPEMSIRLEGVIDNNLTIVESDRISNQVLKSIPDIGGGRVSRREAQAEGERIAKELYPDKPRLWKAVQDAVITKLNRNEQNVVNDVRNDMYTINEAIRDRPSGKPIPTSIKELLDINPNLQPIIDRLPKTELDRLGTRLASIEKQQYPQNAATLARRNEIRGWATGNSAADRQRFMDTNMLDEKIPISWRWEFLEQQRKMLADPNTGRATVIKAYNDLRTSMNAAMEAAGVLPRPGDNTRHNQFLGALQDRIMVYQEENKKLPKGKDLQEIGRQLFQEVLIPPEQRTFGQSVFTGWTPFFGHYTPSTPAHKLEPPPAEWKWRREKWEKEGVTNVTPAMEEQFAREWRRRAYQKMFGGNREQP